jgi:large subunit ribosomal protein L24
VQTTLLGIAIAIILALVTALVGPLFVDWNKYRPQFEAEASRLTGLKVRVAGPIEARLLPTPTLTLQKVDVYRPGEASAVQARKLGIEFALGALMRGEWRANTVRIEGAEFALGIDADGRLDWPAPKVGFDPDALSIDTLDIVDSRALFADAVTGSGVVLDKFEFRGELRSLLGPAKGEGAFVVNGQHLPFRIALSRPDDDGAVRMRLSIDPIDLPLIADADGSLSVDAGIPHFDGTLQLARPVGRAPKGGRALIVEPWRVTSRIKGDSRAAVLEQVEFQYGPDDRAIKLKGDARLSLGRQPQLEGVLSSTQIDLDRMLGLPDAARRRPFAAVKALTDYIAGAHALPVPIKLGISVEQLTLAGAPLQRVSGDVKTDGAGWDIETLDFRAPGAAQVRLSGRLGAAEQGITFAGGVKVEAHDPRAFVSWLADRPDAPMVASASLRAQGDVKLASDAFSVEHLKAELDRMTLEGGLAYAWAKGDRPPRLEATLSAPELNLDRAQALVQGMFGDKTFQWPREGMLAVKVGRASFGGLEATGADVHMRFDSQGLDIERLAVADFAGSSIAVKGHIDTRTRSPRGHMEFDLDARALDGVALLADKVAPSFAETLRRRAGQLVPARLTATLAINSQPSAAGTPNTAGFRLSGKLGGFDVALTGDMAGGAGAFDTADLGKLAAGKLELDGHIAAADGSALVALLGLDRLLAVDQRATRLTFKARGAPNGDMAVEGQLGGESLAVSTKGSLRLSGNDGPAATLDLKIAGAGLRLPGRAADRAAATLPATLTAKLALAEGAVALSDLDGTIAGTAVAGRVRIGLVQPSTVGGELQLSSIDLPATLAAIIGVPQERTTGANNAAADSMVRAGAGTWPTEPFEPGVLGDLRGALKLRVARVALTPKLAAQDVRGVLTFDGSALSFEQIDGALAGGRVTGELAFQHEGDGLSAISTLRLSGANLGEVLAGEGASAMGGHLTFAANIEGSGRSAAALVGSLKGAGTFTLQDGRVAGLDPTAFDAIIHKVDLGLPIDATRIRQGMETALAAGALAIPLAEGEIVLSAGQARAANVAVRAGDSDLAVTANVDLLQRTIDARLLMQGPAALGGGSSGRPEVGVLVKGPLGAPKRSLEVAALTNWLSLRQIEQQTKRIESLESGRALPTKPAEPAAPAATVPPATHEAAPQKNPESPPAAASQEPPQNATGTPPARTRPHRATPAPSAPSAREIAPPPRPPMDIRPLAAPRG